MSGYESTEEYNGLHISKTNDGLYLIEEWYEYYPTLKEAHKQIDAYYERKALTSPKSMLDHTITLCRSDVSPQVWERYCEAVDMPTTCDQISISFRKDDVDAFWEEDDIDEEAD